MIRTLQKKNKKLRERIRFLLGLVCGGVPGKAMIEYIAQENNLSVTNIQSVSFRDKNSCDLNRNYSVTLHVTDCSSVKSHFYQEAFGFAYLNKLFHYKGCNVCDDIFAEYADAVFMDAWLAEHREDKLGTSICILRNADLENILTPFFDANKDCEKVEVEIPIQAQNNVGLIQRKKKQAYFKRYVYRKLGYFSPASGTVCFTLMDKMKFIIRTTQELLIQNKSIKEWTKYKEGRLSFRSYASIMKLFVKIIKR